MLMLYGNGADNGAAYGFELYFTEGTTRYVARTTERVTFLSNGRFGDIFHPKQLDIRKHGLQDKRRTGRQ